MYIIMLLNIKLKTGQSSTEFDGAKEQQFYLNEKIVTWGQWKGRIIGMGQICFG